ncbi:MAG: FAD-binding oxidoreductase [Pseudomonadota bacterium]
MARAYLTANDEPGRHAPSWYAETAGPLPDYAALAGEVSADVCVVGGGYAGLSAALHLAEAGYSVVLLEANRVGWGASGRNGGQLGVGPREDMEKYERLAGREDAAKVWALGVEANRLVRDLIARHGMGVEIADGIMEAAWKAGDADDLVEYADHLARGYGYERFTLFDRGEMAGQLGTDCYHGGLLWRDGGHLHPLRYALGLARAAEAVGARLHERSLVTSVTPGRVETATGAVKAADIVLAMNGYLDGLVPAVARRSMPINNFIIATEPMAPERARSIIRGGFAVADTKFVIDYYRLSPDGRMLWGGGESYGARFPRDIAGYVRGKMLAVYPQLSDLAITHAWGGTLGITITRFPAFQRLKGGLLAISGWSGSGVHMATLGGKLAAEAVRGEAERFDVLARMPVPPFPGGTWFRAPMLAAAMTWYSLRDRLG